MWESSCYCVAFEEGKLIINCQDYRPIAKKIDEKFRDHMHKRLSMPDLAKFLEELTGAFYNAGRAEGQRETTKKIKRFIKEIRGSTGEKIMSMQKRDMG